MVFEKFHLHKKAVNGRLQMVFSDVAFLPSRASLHSMFLEDSGKGLDPGTATCLRNDVGVRSDTLPVKCLSSSFSFRQ